MQSSRDAYGRRHGQNRAFFSGVALVIIAVTAWSLIPRRRFEPPADRAETTDALPLTDTPSSPTEPPTRNERSQLRATWVSAVATGGALLVATGALYGQLDLNQKQDERQQRVYSARVALWAVAGSDHSSVRPDGLDVSIYNRSPAPVYNVDVLAQIEDADNHETTARGVVGSVLPCSVISLRLAAPSGSRLKQRDAAWQYYDALTLRFDVAAQSWVLTKSGLHKRTAGTEMPGGAGLTVRIDKLEPVSDCGEAS